MYGTAALIFFVHEARPCSRICSGIPNGESWQNLQLNLPGCQGGLLLFSSTAIGDCPASRNDALLCFEMSNTGPSPGECDGLSPEGPYDHDWFLEVCRSSSSDHHDRCREVLLDMDGYGEDQAALVRRAVTVKLNFATPPKQGMSK